MPADVQHYGERIVALETGYERLNEDTERARQSDTALEVRVRRIENKIAFGMGALAVLQVAVPILMKYWLP